MGDDEKEMRGKYEIYSKGYLEKKWPKNLLNYLPTTKKYTYFPNEKIIINIQKDYFFK